MKNIKSPETIPELRNFENDLINMAQDIEFEKFENTLQKNLKNICEKMEKEPKLIIPANKTSNFYKIATSVFMKNTL